MGAYDRAVRGAEAGAIAAVTLEVAFFLLDAVRLSPLATPLALSGAVPTPGGVFLDLTNLSGVLSVIVMVCQVLILTILHLLAFGVVGVIASLAFDWSEPLNVGRVAAITLMGTVAFYVTGLITGTAAALAEVGWISILAMNVLAAASLTACLRLICPLGLMKAAVRRRVDMSESGLT